VIWADGVSANPLGRKLGAETDRGGRVLVKPDLSLPGHREAFVVRDLAALTDVNGVKVPGVPQADLQMGDHVGRIITHECHEAREAAEPRSRPGYA
jgi:NADH dehydrogenase